jgi:hypothetical protein
MTQTKTEFNLSDEEHRTFDSGTEQYYIKEKSVKLAVKLLK